MADSHDMKPHVQTYEGMLGLLKWGSVATAILTAIVLILIAS